MRIIRNFICLSLSFLISLSAFAKSPAEILVEKADAVVRQATDSETGAGTGQLAIAIHDLAREFYTTSSQLPAAQQQDLDDVRELVLATTNGEPLVILTNNHPAAIEAANRRLAGAGLDFIRVVRDESLTPTPVDKPLPHEAKKYKIMTVARMAIVPPLAWFSTAIGSGFSPSGMSGAVAPLALEVQFITLSSKWARFWDKFGFGGNVFVNVMYGAIATGALTAAQLAFGEDAAFNLRDFFVKSVVMGPAFFVSSFGAAQIATARLQTAGEVSEGRRFAFETWSVLWNNFGRTVALGAAALGASHQIFDIAGVGFGTGELIGWGIMASYATAMTIPLWLKIKAGDRALDQATQNLLTLQPEKTTACQRALSWVSSKWSLKR